MEFIETLNLYPSRDGVSLAIAKLTCLVESPLHQLPIMFSSWVWAEPQSAWWRNQKHLFLHGGATKKRWNVKKAFPSTTMANTEAPCWNKKIWMSGQKDNFCPLQKALTKKICFVTASPTLYFSFFFCKGMKKGSESWIMKLYLYSSCYNQGLCKVNWTQSMTPPSRWWSKFFISISYQQTVIYIKKS